jgi:hypothetical protein
MHTHTCIHTHTCMHAYTHIHTCMHACIHTCIHTYIHRSVFCVGSLKLWRWRADSWPLRHEGLSCEDSSARLRALLLLPLLLLLLAPLLLTSIVLATVVSPASSSQVLPDLFRFSPSSCTRFRFASLSIPAALHLLVVGETLCKFGDILPSVSSSDPSPRLSIAELLC